MLLVQVFKTGHIILLQAGSRTKFSNMFARSRGSGSWCILWRDRRIPRARRRSSRDLVTWRQRHLRPTLGEFLMEEFMGFDEMEAI